MSTTFKDKYFSVLGDSMSTLQNYSVPEDAAFYEGGRRYEFGVFAPEDTWWGQLIDALGGRLLVNDSFSGSTVSRDPLHEYPSYGCSDERTGSLHKGDTHPDVILILMGANDLGCRVQLRGDGDWAFERAYRLMVQKLRANYPKAQLWCITLPTAQALAGKSEYASAYSDVIRNCADEAGCRIIELDVVYTAPDGLHPDKQGMKTLSEHILNQL